MPVQVIAFLLAIASVLVSVVNTGAESKTFDVEGQNDPEHDLTYRPDFFHAVFAVASAYLCMLYLSWNLNLLPGEGDAQFQVRCLLPVQAAFTLCKAAHLNSLITATCSTLCNDALPLLCIIVLQPT